MMVDVKPATEAILRARAAVPVERSVLVALSGIDGSGKGYVGERLAAALLKRGLRTAVVNIDGWLRLPQERFSDSDPGGHFYRNAIRFDELFAELVLPLRDRRCRRVIMDFVDETAARTRRHTYDFDDIDVILLEGIFLLKRQFRVHYDLSIWIECSFSTALGRAIARAQEGLDPEATVRAYRTIYFPAQQIHFMRDDPKEAATISVRNDCVIEPAGASQSVEMPPC